MKKTDKLKYQDFLRNNGDVTILFSLEMLIIIP
jgi:hypothetical protein